MRWPSFALLILIVPTLTWGQRELTRRDVVFAAFGDSVQNYGSSKIPELQKLDAIPVVSCYAVTNSRILVCDVFRPEIKCYTRRGEYLSTIPVWPRGGPIDIAVVGVRLAPQSKVFEPRIVTLHESPIMPVDHSIEWSRYQLLVYDMDTGREVAHEFFHCDGAGTDERGHEVHGSVILHCDGTDLGLVDVSRQLTFPLLSDGNFVTAAMQRVSKSGWGISTRILSNEASTMAVGYDGRERNILPTLMPIAVAGDGERLATARVENDETVFVSIYSSRGEPIASARRSIRPYAFEGTASSWNTYKLVGDSLFELRVDDAGVHVIEWK